MPGSWAQCLHSSCHACVGEQHKGMPVSAGVGKCACTSRPTSAAFCSSPPYFQCKQEPKEQQDAGLQHRKAHHKTMMGFLQAKAHLRGLSARRTLRPLSHWTPGNSLSSISTMTDTTTIAKSNCTGSMSVGHLTC